MAENDMSESLKVGAREANGDTLLRRELEDLAKDRTRLEFQNRVLEKKLEENRVQIEELLKENSLLAKRFALAIKQSEEVNKDFVNEKSKNRSLQDEIRRLKVHDEVVKREENKFMLKNARDTSMQTDRQDTVEILHKDGNNNHSLKEELDDLKKDSNTKREEMKKLHAEIARVTLALTYHQDIVSVLKGQQKIERALQEELDRLRNKSSMTTEEIKKLRWTIGRVIRALTDQWDKVDQLRKNQNMRHSLQEKANALKEDSCMRNEEIERILQEQLAALMKSSVSKEEIEELRSTIGRVVCTLSFDGDQLDVFMEAEKEEHTLQEALDALNKMRYVTKKEMKKLRAKIARVTRVLVFLEEPNESTELSDSDESD